MSVYRLIEVDIEYLLEFSLGSIDTLLKNVNNPLIAIFILIKIIFEFSLSSPLQE